MHPVCASGNLYLTPGTNSSPTEERPATVAGRSLIFQPLGNAPGKCLLADAPEVLVGPDEDHPVRDG